MVTFRTYGHGSSSRDISLLGCFRRINWRWPIMVFYGKKVFRHKHFVFALSLSLMGMVIFACFTETGHRQFHCNFIWQAIVTNYLLYMVSIHLFIKSSFTPTTQRKVHVLGLFKYFLEHRQYKALLVFSLFLSQCAGGFYYLVRMLVRNGSYA